MNVLQHQWINQYTRQPIFYTKPRVTLAVKSTAVTEKRIMFLLVFHIHCLCSLKIRTGDMSNKSVEFVRRIFVFVTATRQPYSDTERHMADSFWPNMFVQFGVNTNILSAHHPFSEHLYFLNSFGGFFL